MAYVTLVKIGELKVIEVGDEMFAVELQESGKGRRIKMVIHATDKVFIHHRTTDELIGELVRRGVYHAVKNRDDSLRKNPGADSKGEVRDL